MHGAGGSTRRPPWHDRDRASGLTRLMTAPLAHGAPGGAAGRATGSGVYSSALDRIVPWCLAKFPPAISTCLPEALLYGLLGMPMNPPMTPARNVPRPLLH